MKRFFTLENIQEMRSLHNPDLICEIIGQVNNFINNFRIQASDKDIPWATEWGRNEINVLKESLEARMPLMGITAQDDIIRANLIITGIFYSVLTALLEKN